MDGHAIKEPSATLIKEAHLRLDDIPPELLPVHQEKVRERVSMQKKFEVTTDSRCYF